LRRRPLAVRPQPDHPEESDPIVQQHLQQRGRAVRRQIRRRFPLRRRAPQYAAPRGPQRRRHPLDAQERADRVRPGGDEPFEFIYGYDPRVCWIEDRYYVTWCNAYGGWPTIGVGFTHHFEPFYQTENAFVPYNRNGVLFPRKVGGRYAMLSRPSDRGHTPFGDIYFSESPDMLYWGHHRIESIKSNSM
jgi:hypothetical protein